MNRHLYDIPKMDDLVIEPTGDEFILGKYSGVVIDTFLSLNSIMIYLKSINNTIPLWFFNRDGTYTKSEVKT
jgi:hypothetical protein